MDKYAVMGNPVSHSKSPLIHSLFAAQTGQALVYSAIHVETAQFEQAVNSFFAQGGKGLNVAVPFKQQAWELADVHSENAERACAVNTLFLDAAGVIHGHNTDGIGLIRDIRLNHKAQLANKSILLLGAGGASRGILLPLLKEEPDCIVIANRTTAKAEELATLFTDSGDVQACGLDALEGLQFDWVINASSASLKGQLPALPAKILKPGACCYDLMYGDEETIFCRWAVQSGAEKVMDGLGMLVEQAAESFYLWRGIRPETSSVIASLR